MSDKDMVFVQALRALQEMPKCIRSWQGCARAACWGPTIEFMDKESGGGPWSDHLYCEAHADTCTWAALKSAFVKLPQRDVVLRLESIVGLR